MTARPRVEIRSGLIDHYLARRIVKPFLVTIFIVVVLLSLENASRLLDLISDVDEPVVVLFKFLFFLIPEYLGIGLLLAVFISVAFCFRGLALSGELDIFWSVGLSPWRVLRVPLLLGLVVCVAHIGVRGYLQPWGEARLDALGKQAGSGDLGVAIKAGQFQQPSPNVTLYVDRINRAESRFGGVLVQTRRYAVVAREATARSAGRKGILLTLTDGHVVYTTSKGMPQPASFMHMELPLNVKEEVKRPQSSRQVNDRLVLEALLAKANAHLAPTERYAAWAALGARVMSALFVMVLPLLAFVLGIPPKRSTTGYALGLGILLIVGFIQMILAIEDMAAPFSLPGQILVLIVFTGFALAFLRLQARYGFGAVEAFLDGIAQHIWRRIAPAVKLFRRNQIATD
jgi:lipopolysaccharide export system permease protein